MRRQISKLIFDFALLVFFSVAGTARAVTEPSWLCLIYGGIMTLYLVNVINDIVRLNRMVRVSKKTAKLNAEAKNGKE